MIKKLIKQNLRFYSKFALLIGALISFICSFGVSTYAWSVGSDGNLQSDNLIDNSANLFELGAVSYNPGATYSSNKVSGNYRIRTINLIDVDSTKTYSLSVPSPYWVIAQGYNNGLQVSQEGTQFNQALPSLSFTGVSQVAIIVRRIDNGNFSSAFDISNIDLMFNIGSVMSYEPYAAIYYSQENYNNVAQDLLGGLEGYDAIDLYYLDSITYVSTDNGQTFTNANNQDVSNNYVYGLFDRNNLIIDKDNPWNANAIYMVRVNFSQPIFLWRLQILNSAKPTTFLKVVCNDLTITNFNYFVDTEQGNTSYIISDNIFQTCDSVEFYFKINQYVSGTSTSWILDYKGYNVGIDSYNEGYSDGTASLQPIIDGLNENINILKAQVQNLTLQLQQGNSSWYSLFFAMADTPFKTASNFLGFEIFGVNLFNALIGFITILAIFWVFKRLIK